MSIFIFFIFGSLLFGAGVMLAPAWPSQQPRIGLAAALALALVTGGSVFWAEAFGWDTLVIDYLLFALMSGVVLSGALSQGQARAEARGETLSDDDQGWPGPQDLAFFGLVTLLVAMPLLMLPVPLGRDGLTPAYLALTAQLGGSFSNLAPFQPDIDILYAPGFQALTAYLAHQLDQPIPTIQMAMGSVVALLAVWLAYDLGTELRDKALGRAMSLALLAGMGLASAWLRAHFGGLMGLLFTLAFLLYALRYLRHRYPMDVVAAGLMLGAVVLVNPTWLLVLLAGFAGLLIASVWLSIDDDRTSVILLAIATPLVALLGIAPWLINTLPLLNGDIASPYVPSMGTLWALISGHNPLVLLLAVIGTRYGWRSGSRDERRLIVAALIWLVIVLDLAVTGWMARLLPALGRYLHPERVAEHGPIIPYTLLAAYGLLWLWHELLAADWRARLRGSAYHWVGAGLVAGVIGWALLGSSLRDGDLLPGLRADVTAGDLAALRWLRDQAADDALLLNHPEDGLWAAMIAGREAVFYPEMAFTSSDPAPDPLLLAFWDDPNTTALTEAGVDYVIVPERDGRSLDALDGLTLVYRDGGAAVYALGD